MDGISFVMGEKTNKLRVRRLGELIHGASIGRPIANSCSVTARFEMPDSSSIEFQRMVVDKGASCTYKINKSTVSAQVYASELEKMGINVKARNFLVFQGAVESIAMKNAKERTALFEEISNSGTLREEYNNKKAEMTEAETESQCTYQKKKGIAAERKEAKLEKLEAERYERLKEEYDHNQIVLHLFKLYHMEREIERLNGDLQAKKVEVANVEREKEAADEALRQKKKQVGVVGRELSKVEQDIRDVEAEKSKKHTTYIKSKEKVSHTQNKLDSAKKSLEQANRADQKHQADIQKLKTELDEQLAKKKRFEDEMAGESAKRGRDITLQKNQVQEYDKLKQQADATSARYLADLDSINREQKSDQDLLDSEINKQSNLEEQLKKKELELQEIVKRKEKLIEHIRSSQQALEDQVRLKEELKNDVGSSKDRIAELQGEMENVRDQLGDAKIDKHEEARRRKKQEVSVDYGISTFNSHTDFPSLPLQVVELFQREVPGVHGRMINMCEPTHKRYNVAITKVLGKYMEAIIVDTEKTARRCIQILKEQMLEVETFLPLDYLQTKPLKERLRNITEPRNVKLVYDVLKYDPPEIEKAVLFATNNALVCESPEDAMKVAYEMDRNRYDALSLDGTFYQKGGIISGGSSDLARKAKRWDEKEMVKLKAAKEKLNEEMKEMLKKTRKQGELTTVESQIRGLENRLKYSKNDKDGSEKLELEYNKQLKRIQEEVHQLGPKIKSIEQRMADRDKKIQEVKNQMNSVEDRVYADFCKGIGVANIREYEERELVLQQDRAKKMSELEQQIDRIGSHLEFARSKTTKDNVDRWERVVQDEEDALEKQKRSEATQRAAIDADNQRIEKLKQEKQEKKVTADQLEEETAKARRDVAVLAKELHQVIHQSGTYEAKIEAKQNERMNSLLQAKMETIQIPVHRGTLEEVFAGANSTDMGSDVVPVRDGSNIEINFEMLPRDLMNVSEGDAVKKKGDSLQKELQSKWEMLERIQTPNLKAMQKLDMVSEKVATTNQEFENARKKTRKAKGAFEKVKYARTEKFNRCYNHITEVIDGIYKSLAQNEAAQAYLSTENPEEPYLGGLDYNCVAPGKRFQPMSNLSGGEKTIAALALLFAIHSYQPSPFFVLDEIDAALDNTNIGKVARYIKESTTNLQTIVISLKEEFYRHANCLIGISPDVSMR